MRLTLSTLPQLAVLAKILCLLMVVMCGAVPSSVSSVSLYSTCSRGNVTVMKMVTSKKQNDHNAPYQRLTTKSHEPFTGGALKIYIYAEAAEKYICFNKRGRVVAKKKKDELCQFHEVYSGRYLRYVSAIDPTRYLGFNKVGKSIPWPRGSPKCYNFLKMYPKAGVQNHHNKPNNKPHHHQQHHQQQQLQQQQHQQQRLRSLSSSSSSSSLSSSSSSSLSSSHPKSLQRSSNSLLHHQERTRHRHGWRRRQHLRQQQQQRHHQLQQHVMRPYQESKY